MASSGDAALVQACAALSMEEEGGEIGFVLGKADVVQEVTTYHLCAVGKLLTEKPFRFHVFRDTMASV